MENGVVVGTRNPTGDYLLLDCRFELPYGECFTLYRTLSTFGQVGHDRFDSSIQHALFTFLSFYGFKSKK